MSYLTSLPCHIERAERDEISKNNKHMKLTPIIILGMFLTAGCGHETPQNTDPVEFSVDKTSLSFTDEGGDQTFTVTTSETLYLVPGADWVKATKGEINRPLNLN